MQRTRYSLLTVVALAGLVFVGGLTAVAVSPSPAQAQGLAASGAVFTMTNATDGNAVLAFRRSARGALSFLDAYDAGGTGTGGGLGNQGALTLDQSGNRLFVVNAGSDTVAMFGIRPSGLHLLDVAPSGGSQPISVTVDGDLLYVLNAGGDGSISGLEVGNDGTLSPLAGSTRPLSGSGTGPAQISFSPDGRVLVVTEKATNYLVTYSVGDDGLPSAPVATPSEGMTPFGFSFGKRNRLFVSEAFGGNPGASTVSSYQVHADGSIVPITSSLATTQSAACWLVATGNGRYAYVTNTGSDSITGLELARNGEMSLLDADGFTAGSDDSPIDAALSRNGRFLYVLNGGDETLTAYRVRSNGSLRPLAGIGGLPAGTNGLAAQ